MNSLGGDRNFRVNPDRDSSNQTEWRWPGDFPGQPAQSWGVCWEVGGWGSAAEDSDHRQRGSKGSGSPDTRHPGLLWSQMQRLAMPLISGCLDFPRPRAPLAGARILLSLRTPGAQSFALDTHPFLPVTPLPGYPAPLRVIYPSGDAGEEKPAKAGSGGTV